MEQAFRAIDHGPPSEDKAAAANFRRFWGPKAELRRFRDGSLLETLVWDQRQEKSIILQIVEYVFQRHGGQNIARNIQKFGDTFNDLLPNPEPADPNSAPTNAFHDLESDIRGLQGLPLQIRQITAASPQLRYASLTNEQDAGSAEGYQTRQPVDILVQFEGSARWPNDFEAVQRTKIAFLLKIGELLENKRIGGLSTRLGLENELSKLVNIAFLDITFLHGVVFRLRIHHERELVLLEGALKDKDSTVGKCEDIAQAISTYKRVFVQRPLHTQAVRTLCTRFPLLSPSMRLLKKWRNCHLLSDHISDELIELLMIRTFIHPHPWQAPGSLTAAFLRTLNFISKWQWQTEPLIVDFGGSMGDADINGIHLRFEAWRKIDPAMNRIVMFAASNFDPEGISWTETGPAKVVAARFTGLARAAWQSVKSQGLGYEAGSLFTPSTVEYDFVIHISPKYTHSSHSSEQKKPVFKNLQIDAADNISEIGADPVAVYVQQLRTLLGSNVLFFYDEWGGPLIGGIWNPCANPRHWKTNMTYSTMPLRKNGEDNIVLNKQATLNDIARLGGDLVSKLEVQVG